MVCGCVVDPERVIEPSSERMDLPDEILRSNDTGRDSVAKGVQLDCLMSLKVFLSQKDVKVGVLLH